MHSGFNFGKNLRFSLRTVSKWGNDQVLLWEIQSLNKRVIVGSDGRKDDLWAYLWRSGRACCHHYAERECHQSCFCQNKLTPFLSSYSGLKAWRGKVTPATYGHCHLYSCSYAGPKPGGHLRQSWGHSRALPGEGLWKAGMFQCIGWRDGLLLPLMTWTRDIQGWAEFDHS